MIKQKIEDDGSIQHNSSNPWYYQPFFKYAVAVLLILTILWVFSEISIFLKPILDFISILFVPIVISFLFYYLLRPIVYYFEKFNVPRFVTIIIIYIIIALFVILFIAYIGPNLAKQVSSLANMSMKALEQVTTSSQSVFSRFFNININNEIEQRLFSIAQYITTALSKNLLDLIGFITRLAAIFAVIPFVVFYLLKDDHQFAESFMRHIPRDFEYNVRKILRNMDHTLSTYITGLILVSSSLGFLLFIGYLVIGLEYAMILAIIAFIFTTIPFLGPFLAITPAILVGLSDSPFMVLKVVIVFLIVQQCESNIISPLIIGQRLNIHPLTIILLLLAAGSLYGLLGLILATPFYALFKVLVDSIYKIYQLRYSHRY